MALVDQRGAPRTRLWLPIRLRTDAGETAQGVTYDVSETGVLILVRAAIAVETRVTLSFEVPGEGSQPAGQPLESKGHVVHAEPNAADPSGLWRHRAGIVLDEPMGEFRTVVERLMGAAVYPPASSRR